MVAHAPRTLDRCQAQEGNHVLIKYYRLSAHKSLQVLDHMAPWIFRMVDLAFELAVEVWATKGPITFMEHGGSHLSEIEE